MHTLAEAATTEMIHNPEFQQQWNDSRTVMCGGFHEESEVQEALNDFVPI
jgi:hypothetical protein